MEDDVHPLAPVAMLSSNARALNVEAPLSQAEKRFDAMRRNPAGDWTIEDVEVVCRAFGAVCAPPGGGSHYRVAHSAMDEILTIPRRRPIKAVYIRDLIAFIDKVEGKHGSTAI